jgi:hypothetical protein
MSKEKDITPMLMHHATEPYMRKDVTHISLWDSVESCKLQTLLLSPQVKSSFCPLDRRLHAAQNQSGCDDDEKNLCPYQNQTLDIMAVESHFTDCAISTHTKPCFILNSTYSITIVLQPCDKYLNTEQLPPVRDKQQHTHQCLTM